jgi:TetR/AcrR family transcriptional regulator
MARALPATSRTERRKARTVAAILDAAERQFVERGFENARIDEVAADADVAVGSIYNHFGSKEGLHGALLERALELFQAYLAEEPDADLSALERVLDTTGHLARFARERPGQMRLLCLLPPAAAQDELAEVAGRVSAVLAERERETAALIEAAVRRGDVQPLNARDAAAFLWAAWKGMLTLGPRAERAAPGQDRELRALVETGLRVVVGGLASDRARASDETVRAILEGAPARPDEDPLERPLALRRVPAIGELRDDFPELALWTAEVATAPGPSPEAVVRRLAAPRTSLPIASAIGSRGESTPWAYRVFARRLGVDPEAPERAAEAAALHLGRLDAAAATGLPDDALLIAVAETGVPVLAFDADRLDGELWLRPAVDGERLGSAGLPVTAGRPLIADRTRALAVPFGSSDPGAAVTGGTERMAFAAVQVKGVPDVSMEEALWTVVEIIRGSG